MKKQILCGLVFTVFTTGCASWFSRSDKATLPAPKPNEKLVDLPSDTAPEPDAAKVDSITQAQTAPVTITSDTMPKAEDATLGWAYEGMNGPENWGNLKPEYILCKSGKFQSPINLKWSKPKTGGEVLLNYKPTPLKLRDSGHNLEVVTEDGGSAMLHGQPYKLMQVEFHTPSEHQLSGNALPLEAHFVHKNKKGEIAIVSAILIQGAGNPEIEKLWSAWPNIVNAEVSTTNEEFNPMVLLPRKTTHYFYVGSLTTPPCTEGVKWFVLNTPVEISKEQIAAFRSHYANNARPLQNAKGRQVINY